MAALLYYSISSDLTKDETIAIDERVAKNREGVYLFVRKLPSNSKRKAKRLGFYIVFMFAISQPLVPCAAAVMMPLPPVAIHRSSPIEQDIILSNKNGYPQIATIPESKVDKIRLTNDQIKEFNNLALQLNSGSITMEEAVLQLRGGELSDIVGVIAFVIFINWYDSLFGVEAFQANPLPHQDPFGWLSGKYDSKNAGNGQCLSHPPSRFERETLHTMKQMCAASADENGFVMNYDEAYNLVKETYSGSMQVTEDFKITDWQAASHLYHGKGVNVNPEDFGITQAELIKIQDEGFIKYVQRGNKLPSIEHVRSYQKSLKDICLDPSTDQRDDSEYYNPHGVTPTTAFKNDRYLVCFNQTTGDLITGDKQRRGTTNKFDQTNKIGSKKWIDKWSK
jgi:hypothetical protein